MTTLITAKESAPTLNQSQKNLPGIASKESQRSLSHEEIARSAYDIYVKSGHQPGRCGQNWQQAEQTLRHQADEPVRQAQQQRAGTFGSLSVR